eukprot:1872485-Pyramimonas_sp.AAC.1
MPEYAYVKENRKCRDVLFLLLFFFFSLGMIVIAGYGYNHGDPVVLVYGPDYNGNICNQDSVRDGWSHSLIVPGAFVVEPQ